MVIRHIKDTNSVSHEGTTAFLGQMCSNERKTKNNY